MQPTRVLVVDSFRDAADTLAFLLTSYGFDARAVYSAADALEMARSWLPAALVVDIMLPQMTGHDLAVAIRREVVPAPMFIAVTGYQDGRLPERSRALDFAAHFMKPCDPDKIFRVLEQARAA